MKLCSRQIAGGKKQASFNTSFLEAHEVFFQIACEGDSQSLCTVTFRQKSLDLR